MAFAAPAGRFSTPAGKGEANTNRVGKGQRRMKPCVVGIPMSIPIMPVPPHTPPVRVSAEPQTKTARSHRGRAVTSRYHPVSPRPRGTWPRPVGLCQTDSPLDNGSDPSPPTPLLWIGAKLRGLLHRRSRTAFPASRGSLDRPRRLLSSSPPLPTALASAVYRSAVLPV